MNPGCPAWPRFSLASIRERAGKAPWRSVVKKDEHRRSAGPVLSEAEQRTVFAGAPTGLGYALHLRGPEKLFSGGREHTRLRGYALDQLFLGQFKELDNLIARDGGVVFKKFGDGRATFDVIEKVLNGDASSLKAGGSADPVRVNPDHLLSLNFCSTVISSTYLKAGLSANRARAETEN